MHQTAVLITCSKNVEVVRLFIGLKALITVPNGKKLTVEKIALMLQYSYLTPLISMPRNDEAALGVTSPIRYTPS